VLALASARPVAAQPAAGESKPSIVMPKLVHDEGVAYPKAALDAGFAESVTVVLVVEIDRDGNVTRVTPEQKWGHGFDEAAVAAAQKLRFSPALKNGVPVPSRIKFRYLFEAPPATLSGSVTDRATGDPVAGARVTLRFADGREIGVETAADGTWRASNLPAGRVHLVVEAAEHSASEGNVDVFRGKATDVTFRLEPKTAATGPAPGPVARPPVEVVVRGEKLPPAVTSFTREEVRQLPGAFGDPFRAIEALPGVTPIVSGLPFFYVRGAPPGNVGYFLDGIRVPYLYHVGLGPSVIHPGMVDRVDLYPGGYPAEFGRFAGGIVSAETTTPRTDAHGEGNIRLFDAGALVETGFAGGRGTVLLGGRYSYTAKIISLLAPDITLDYRDYQARVSYDVGRHDRVSLIGFGAYDLLGQTQNGIFTVLFGSEFYRADLRYDHSYASGQMQTDVTLGFDQTRIGDQQNAQDRSLAVRTEVHHRLEPGVLLRSGADTTIDAYTADDPYYSDPEDPGPQRFNNLFPPRTDLAMGAWSDLVLDVDPRIELTPGLRVDVYSSGGASALAVDPRLAARFKITDELRIVHAYGLVHQPPSFIVPVPGLTPGKLQGGLQSALQTSAGVEADLPDNMLAKATLFYNAFFDMTDTIGTARRGGGNPFETRSLGSGVGLELYLHRKLTKRLGGFVSYTLSRSMRYVGPESFPSTFDRTHVANAAIAYDLGRRWRAGTRLVYYTGTPKNPRVGAGVIAPLRSSTPDRNPSFYRVDLRLEKRWQLTKTVWISFVAEVLNATLSKEVFNDTEIGPVTIPSIGVEGGF